MKKLLLVSTLLIGLPFASRADVATIDITAIKQAVQDATQALQEAQRIEQAATTTYQQLMSAVNPNTYIQPLLSMANPLPSMGNISQMITGGESLGNLTGLSSAFKSANTVYSPTSTGATDFVASLLGRQSNSWSNTQAMAAQELTDAQARVTALQNLQGQIPDLQSEADLTKFHDELGNEQAKLQALQIQMQGTSLMAGIQNNQYQLQEMQRQRQSADDLMTSFGGTAGPNTGNNALVANNTPNVPNFVAGN